MGYRKYTEDEIKYLEKIIPGHSYQEIADMFNKRYKTTRMTTSKVKSFVGNRKLNTGRTGRFEKGQLSWNKGKKGVCTGGEATQFKKGNRPHNYKPIGTERINGDDYVDIKIADPNKWKGKHILVWEEVNGPVPKEHIVIFGDGNNRNFDPDNLILISRKQLAIMNKNRLIQNSAELTKTGIVIADIYLKIGERNKRRGRKHRVIS